MSIASVALSPVHEDYCNFPGESWAQNGPWLKDSILIFLAVAGSVIPLRVLESDSIASVKFRIQTYKGFFVKKQKLVFDGKELARNNSCVHDYGVTDGDVLHLVLRLSDLQTITVRTVCGKEFEFHIQRNRNIGYVKQQVAERGKGFFDLNSQELVCNGEELEDQRVIDDICRSDYVVLHLLVCKSAKFRANPLEKDFEVSIIATELQEQGISEVDERVNQTESLIKDLQVVSIKNSEKDFILEPLRVNRKVVLLPVIKQLLYDTYVGLERGNQPVRSTEGSGGAYFMQDSSGKKYVSVFKPIDEEPMALNNPIGLPLTVSGEGLKKGTRVGEGALREVAAYILDHLTFGQFSFDESGKGFAGVPPTFMIKCRHKGFNYPEGYDNSHKNIKIGSLQMFIENCESCEDMGPCVFPVDDVHKISVLDIRLANADRHAGNILLHRDAGNGQIKLIPIDHGYCLPESFEDCTFDWLYWPQARQQFSPEIIGYIKSLDADKDIELLKFYGWELPCECARVLRISTMLLKKGAERGLTPYVIGSIMCRETLKKESVIEQIVQEACEGLLPGSSEAGFLESVSSILDRHLDSLYIYK